MKLCIVIPMKDFSLSKMRSRLDDVKSSIEGLSDLIAEKNPDFSIIQFHSKVRDRLNELTLEEKLDNVRKIGQFTDYDERLKTIAFHPKLIAVVEKILGAESRTLSKHGPLNRRRTRKTVASRSRVF